MKLIIALGLLGVVLAQQYGGGAAPSGPSYPPSQSNPSIPAFPFWPPHHHHHSSSSESRSRSRSHSRSHSRSDSKEDKECHKCKKVKKFHDSNITTLEDASISYLQDKRGCLRAVLTCPFGSNNYTLFAGNSIDDNVALSTGFNIQRVVKCNKKGKWEVEDPATGNNYRFKLTACQNNGIETPV